MSEYMYRFHSSQNPKRGHEQNCWWGHTHTHTLLNDRARQFSPLTHTMNRPSPISRSSGSSLSSPSSQQHRSATMGNTNLKRPSLLRDLRQDDDLFAEEVVKEDCHSPWTVGDTQLRPIPMFYPPLNPQCTAFITDAPPSVVAARVSDCLKRRSVSVEYDEETVSG